MMGESPEPAWRELRVRIGEPICAAPPGPNVRREVMQVCVLREGEGRGGRKEVIPVEDTVGMGSEIEVMALVGGKGMVRERKGEGKGRR
jgi:hypothetical protein